MSKRPVALPSKLTLGGFPWTVVRKKVPRVYGTSNGWSRKITITPKQDRLSELDTLVHELFHSILRAQGTPYDDAHEERYVSGLATGLVGALNTNPQLLAYITASLKP